MLSFSVTVLNFVVVDRRGCFPCGVGVDALVRTLVLFGDTAPVLVRVYVASVSGGGVVGVRIQTIVEVK
jgi:hypothetical protein